MANYLHRTTKQYLTSVSPASLQEPEANYIEQPDLSAVAGQPSKYWIITGDVVSLVDQATQDAIDAQEDSDRLDSIASKLDITQDIWKAFAEVMLDQLNTLRAFHGLPDASLEQLKTAVRNKL